MSRSRRSSRRGQRSRVVAAGDRGGFVGDPAVGDGVPAGQKALDTPVAVGLAGPAAGDSAHREPSLPIMLGVVAGLVAGVILVFSLIGYVVGKLVL